MNKQKRIAQELSRVFMQYKNFFDENMDNIDKRLLTVVVDMRSRKIISEMTLKGWLCESAEIKDSPEDIFLKREIWDKIDKGLIKDGLDSLEMLSILNWENLYKDNGSMTLNLISGATALKVKNTKW